MDYHQAIKRLKTHAGLPGEGEVEPSLLQLLYEADRTSHPPLLVAVCKEIMDCLEVLNIHLNGSVPSETPSDRKTNDVDRWLVYAIGLIINEGWCWFARWQRGNRFDAEVFRSLADTLWSYRATIRSSG